MDSIEIRIECIYYDAMGRRYWAAPACVANLVEDILKDVLLDIIKTKKPLKVKK